VRTQSRIKAELSFYGIHQEEPKGRWTRYTSRLCGVSGLRTAGCRRVSTACWSFTNF
jgi:hypothetical protein